MTLQDLAPERQDYSYGFLDSYAKRELRRRMLKAIAIPGYQVPYASRELPIARGWGTGGLQVSLSLVGPESVVKVIDQGADDSVNAANLRRFITRMSGAATTTDALKATILQSRHRIPEEILGENQALVLQVPDPEPLRGVQSDISKAHEMHADADYAQLWLLLYEQLVRYKQYVQGASYPALVNGRYIISPSPIPRWDNAKLHQAANLTLLSAGREKRLYAVPPYTNVYPLEFSDVPFEVEDQEGWMCRTTGVTNKFMNELPQADGTSQYELSDSGYAGKLAEQPETLGKTYYDNQGNFYHAGYLKPRAHHA
ncbi:MAG: alpha-D-ribose 1-methylphosphonate 5-phosphate C-P-lyase PhnJ [Anaerolineae bacterium]|nr:alpha-D-ribose 1-methylphosphonate 5-phosphate C-P-lyase PhnJ [Anaerolineae bacterium]